MTKPEIQFEAIAVIGVGLIGGSIALAARECGSTRRIVGVGRNKERLATAQQQGIIDQYCTDISQIPEVELVIVCTPVDRIAADVRAALDVTHQATTITDAGSVKANICQAIGSEKQGLQRFVGSHPLAGSHHSGFENASASLYVDRKCVVTPLESTPDTTVAKVSKFWTALQMDVRTMSPEEHDRVLALTSHLPHLAAASLAGLVDEEIIEFAATGFRDTTRVAAGDPELWTAIFSDNSDQLVAVTDELIAQLQAYREAILHGDSSLLVELLSKAQQNRQRFKQRCDVD